MSMQILDCTLRDGGYVNDWMFGRRTIRSILDKLERAHIDIIECGFLTGMVQEKNASLFGSAAEVEAVLPEPPRDALYVAMIAIGEKELHPSLLEPCDGKGIGGIRLTFHQDEIQKAMEWARIIMDKGYLVFMQPVGTTFYTDLELLRLVEQMNTLKPYAFYIVDTLGSMYRNDVSHHFYLIDKNLAPGIHIGFHGHNNMQLAFSNAQVLGKIQTKRTLIIDSSVFGMGRGAGNLPTELIAQYINRNIASRYDVAMVMDIYDEHIAAIRREYEWGYSMPYHIAAHHVCHPNYAAYLINRRTLTVQDIEKIIRTIPEEYKVLYDEKLIERLYNRFQSRQIDDSRAVEQISREIASRKLLLLAPGKTLATEYGFLRDFISREHPYVISVNFADTQFPINACFVSNHKRMDIIDQELQAMPQIPLILTSNIPDPGGERCLYVDYDRYTNADSLISDNAGLMLLNLLRRCGAKECCLAGFDGFETGYRERYYSGELEMTTDEARIQEKQERIRRQINLLSGSMRLIFLTPSPYEQEGTHDPVHSV